MQNKYIKFCLKLNKMDHISGFRGFRSINWLSNNKRVNQCIKTITCKFVNNTCPCYLKEDFEFAPCCKIDARNKFAKLKINFHKANMRRKVISVVGPSLWNSLLKLIKKQII